MNDLQLALLTIGGGAIVLMALYNAWQDWRVKKQTRQRFDAPFEDPLLSGHGKAEPTIHAGAPDIPVGQSLPAQFGEHMLNSGPVTPQAPGPAAKLALPLDERLYAIIYLSIEKNLYIEHISDRLQHLHKAGGKTVRIACTQADEQNDCWYVPAPGIKISNVRFAVLLANRKGPLSAIEYSEFIGKLQQFAELFAADTDIPDMAQVIGRAEQLDAQAAALDTVLGLHCVLPDTVSPQVLQEQLAAADWVNVGRQWWLAEDDQALASVIIHDTPGKRVLSFTLDLPHVVQPLRALDGIVVLGNRIAQTYAGALMDDGGREVNDASLKAIGEQLEQRVQALTNAGFTPGSVSAHVLFA